MQFVRAIILLPYFLVFSSSVSYAQSPSNYLAKSKALAVEYGEQLGQIYPERASELGLSDFDGHITDWSTLPHYRYKIFLREWLRRTNRRLSVETHPDFRVDLEILRRHISAEIKNIEVRNDEIEFFKASEKIYAAIENILTPNASDTDREQARQRFLKYVNGDGSRLRPTVMQWKKMLERQIPRRGQFVWPSELEVNDYLKNSPVYVAGLTELFGASDLQLQSALAKFKEQILDYDEFVREKLLPRARTNPRVPRSYYEVNLHRYGVNLTPEQLEQRALSEYQELLPQFLALAQKIGAQKGLPENERTPFYVSQALRAEGVSGADELMQFTFKIAEDLETLIRDQDLLTLPEWPVVIRQSTEAENAASPFPHVIPAAPLAMGTDKPEYIFPIHPDGSAVDLDSHYYAAAVTLVAHEARPGHELQFAHITQHGSRARAAFGQTSAVVEGWAMYVEHLLMPYHNDEARYGALQSILFRIARAFLDPMVQRGAADEAKVVKVLVDEVGISEVFARTDYGRYVWRWPGQATSYYYGMRALLDVKAQMQAELGPRFSERQFNDAVVSSGFVPFDLLPEVLRRTLNVSMNLDASVSENSSAKQCRRLFK